MIREAVKKVQGRENLSADECRQVFSAIMCGEADHVLVAALLTALQMKGVVADEVLGAVTAMRTAGVHISAPKDAVDIVGTGGDGFGTFNVSTTAAFIAAGAGVVIAKHGNRASTSKSGAADCLAALGYNLEAAPETVEKCIAKNGIGFLFANKMHPAMRFVAPVRKALPYRTIFNLLGPLANPCGARRCALGVYSKEIVPLYIEVLKALGADKALVFCGPDGLDEIGLAGVTNVAELSGGEVREYEFDPQKLFGRYFAIDQIAGGTPEVNAMLTLAVLRGEERGPYRLAAVVNAAAAICAAGKVSSIEEGILMAGESIDSGAALSKLSAMVEMCR